MDVGVEVEVEVEVTVDVVADPTQTGNSRQHLGLVAPHGVSV